jgi:hypothetical protein
LSLVGVLLAVSSCGTPRMTTAEFKYTPGPSRAVQREDLKLELTALGPNTLSNSELDRKRGGFSVAGMDLSIGLQVSTEVAGLIQVVTNLNMNNAGQWTLVASRTQTFPTTGGLTTAGATSPPIAPNTQNQFVVVAQLGGPPKGGSNPSGTQTGDPVTTPIVSKTSSSPNPSIGGGSVSTNSFTTVVGDPTTTQIIQQVTQGSISTTISNRVNNVTVNNQAVLNVTINNAAAISRTLGTIMAANRIGAQVSRR